jgi:hypothetical protein
MTKLKKKLSIILKTSNHFPAPPPKSLKLLHPSELCAGIFKQSMGARNRLGMGLSYWPARLHSPAELVPWNRFLDSLKVQKFGL